MKYLPYHDYEADIDFLYNSQTCPPGYYCDASAAPLVSFNNFVCPGGHYCPNGTKYANQFKCPRGTFNNNTGAHDSSQCMPCPGKYYCDSEGQTWYSKLCSAGKS